MRILLFVSSLAALAVGILVLGNAQSALHEIEAFVLFLIAAVLFVGAAIVEQLTRLYSRLDAGFEAESSSQQRARLRGHDDDEETDFELGA